AVGLAMSRDDILYLYGMLRRRACSTLFPYTTLFRSSSPSSPHPSSALTKPAAPAPTAQASAWPSLKPSPKPTPAGWSSPTARRRSEEHTSELQSREKLVCRLLLEKKK